METLLKEIRESLETRQKGVKHIFYNWNEQKEEERYFEPERGKGTKSYTYRRIQMLKDKLNELKKEIDAGVYDFKG